MARPFPFMVGHGTNKAAYPSLRITRTIRDFRCWPGRLASVGGVRTSRLVLQGLPLAVVAEQRSARAAASPDRHAPARACIGVMHLSCPHGRGEGACFVGSRPRAS